jgi:hypothetical protein
MWRYVIASAIIQAARKLQIDALLQPLIRSLPCVSLLQIRHHSTLTRLEVVGAKLLSDASFLEVARRCLHLKVVNVRGCDGLTDASIIELAKHTGAHGRTHPSGASGVSGSASVSGAGPSPLVRVDLSYCRLLTPAAVEAVATYCSALEEFKIECLSHLSDDNFGPPVRARLSLLHSLSVSRCSRLSLVTLRDLFSFTTRLTELDLSWCKVFDDDALQAVSAACPLRSLNITSCVFITDTGLTALARRSPLLSFLSVSMCPLIQGTALLELARKCPNLADLNVSGCDAITSVSLLKFARECRSLTRVHLGGLRKAVSDAVIAALAQNNPHLRIGLFGGCLQVTDSGVAEIATHCRLLKELDLSSVVQLSDAGLLEISRRLLHLERLILNDCEALRNEGVLSLARRLWKLKTLEIKGCWNVSNATMNQCRELRPLCDVLGRQNYLQSISSATAAHAAGGNKSSHHH